MLYVSCLPFFELKEIVLITEVLRPESLRYIQEGINYSICGFSDAMIHSEDEMNIYVIDWMFRAFAALMLVFTGKGLHSFFFKWRDFAEWLLIAQGESVEIGTSRSSFITNQGVLLL